MVHPITAEIVGSAIAQAKQENASLLLVRLNTPGGLMDAMRETIEKIVSSPVPVVTYVAPSGGRAASAGFFILESGDVAAMAPGTNTGAAHPVLMGGEMDAVMKQKVENDAAAYLRSICAKRGRNSALAETAVRESKSFTEREALDQHLIDLIAPNEQALLAALDGRVVTRFDGSTQTLHTAGAVIEVYQKSLRQTIIAAIADPNIALVLLVIGALGMYVEFTSPGLIAPGVIGAILVLLGLSAISVLPINWLGAALLLLAFALFVLEAKFASHGDSGRGRRGSHGAGGGDADRQPVSRNAHSLEHGHRPGAAVLRSSPCCCFRWCCARGALKWRPAARAWWARSARRSPTWRRRARSLCTANIGTRCRPGRWPPATRVRVTAIDKLKLTVEPVPN